MEKSFYKKKVFVIGGIIIGLSFCLLIKLANFLKIGVLTDFDYKIADLISNFWHPALIKIFSFITFFGDIRVVAVLLILAVAIFLIKNKKLYSLILFIAFLAGEISSFFTKNIFERQRPPFDGLLTDSWGFSFPSGHVLRSIIFYGFIAYFIARDLNSKFFKIIVYFLAAVLIIGVGFSRIYLGVHWLSDVLAGYLFGLIWLIIGIIIMENRK